MLVSPITNLSQDGFSLIRDVLDANNTAELAVGRVEAQRDVSDPNGEAIRVYTDLTTLTAI